MNDSIKKLLESGRWKLVGGLRRDLERKVRSLVVNVDHISKYGDENGSVRQSQDLLIEEMRSMLAAIDQLMTLSRHDDVPF